MLTSQNQVQEMNRSKKMVLRLQKMRQPPIFMSLDICRIILLQKKKRKNWDGTAKKEIYPKLLREKASVEIVSAIMKVYCRRKTDELIRNVILTVMEVTGEKRAVETIE